jgi:hypothetical protein
LDVCIHGVPPLGRQVSWLFVVGLQQAKGRAQGV